MLTIQEYREVESYVKDKIIPKYRVCMCEEQNVILYRNVQLITTEILSYLVKFLDEEEQKKIMEPVNALNEIIKSIFDRI